MDEADHVFAIRTHLLYEVKWLIYAAARFEAGTDGDPYVALIDSAAVHARALLEFAEKAPKAGRFTLAGLGGTPGECVPWRRWANNRVMHLLEREHHRAPWPEGLDNDRPAGSS